MDNASSSVAASVGEWIHRLNEAPPQKAAYAGTPFVARTWSLQNDAVVMTLATFALTLVLELMSLDAVRKICTKNPGVRTYQQGLLMNIVNNGLLGPISYDVVNSNGWISPPLSTAGRIAMVGGILLGHSIGYYLAHRWMHTRRMYWAHRFHHKFNLNVSPTTANAVSLAEYVIAYMLPFIAGAALVRALPLPSPAAPPVGLRRSAPRACSAHTRCTNA